MNLHHQEKPCIQRRTKEDSRRKAKTIEKSRGASQDLERVTSQDPMVTVRRNISRTNCPKHKQNDKDGMVTVDIAVKTVGDLIVASVGVKSCMCMSTSGGSKCVIDIGASFYVIVTRDYFATYTFCDNIVVRIEN